MPNKFILTTIYGHMVAIMEVSPRDNKLKGEHFLSDDCVRRNVEKETFTEVDGEGCNGKLFVLTSDLTEE
jgi:hypothetical protein